MTMETAILDINNPHIFLQFPLNLEMYQSISSNYHSHRE